ncbi:hypothetical protein [Nocardia arizonensis]|uniref:hypothetical protein n=1 Tax=Nocardia arizonensis TaxID=1141647 RepID=UPI0006D21CA9|nr:hypothetical protein [Nocardia arizonensis]
MPQWVDVLPEFLLACLLLAALPGAAAAPFLRRSVRRGRTAGPAAVLGDAIVVFDRTLAGALGFGRAADAR